MLPEYRLFVHHNRETPGGIQRVRLSTLAYELERLPNTEKHPPGRFAGLAVQLESPVESEQEIGRIPAQPESRCRTYFQGINILHVFKDISRIEEHDSSYGFVKGETQFLVYDYHPSPAFRQSGPFIFWPQLKSAETSDRSSSTGEKTLSGQKVPAQTPAGAKSQSRSVDQAFPYSPI